MGKIPAAAHWLSGPRVVPRGAVGWWAGVGPSDTPLPSPQTLGQGAGVPGGAAGRCREPWGYWLVQVSAPGFWVSSGTFSGWGRDKEQTLGVLGERSR